MNSIESLGSKREETEKREEEGADWTRHHLLRGREGEREKEREGGREREREREGEREGERERRDEIGRQSEKK